MATVQILQDLGEQMGLKGTELRDFITQQQDLESALIVARLIIWLKIVEQHWHVLDVEKWVTLVGTVNWPQDVSTV